MNEKAKFKIVFIVLMVTIISIIFVSTIYANYAITIGKASDKAYVAKWNITINDVSDIFTEEHMINVCNKDENGNAIIAPGVSGIYSIFLKNAGDVKANVTKIDITKTEDSSLIPLIFSIDGGKTWKNMNEPIEISNQIINPGESKEIAKLYWKWPSEGNEMADTLVGIASSRGRKKFVLKVNVAAEQYMQ